MPDLNNVQARLCWQLPFEGAWPTAVALLEGNRLAAGNQVGRIFIWQLPAGSPAETETSPDQGSAREAPSLAPIRRLDGHENGITRLVASPDGRQLISASLDHSIRIWNIDGPAEGTAEVVMDAESRASEAKRTRNDEVLNRPTVSVQTQTADHILAGHGDWVQALAICADGRRLVSGDAAAQVIVWNLEQRKEITRWRGHSWNWIVAAALTPGGQQALVSEYRYKRDDFDIPAAAVGLWSVADGSLALDILKVQVPKLEPQDSSYSAAQAWRKFVAGGLIAADISPDGKLIALGQGGETDTGQVHLIESSTGTLLRDVSGHRYGITDVRFSPDGRHLFTAGRDTTLRIIRVEDGKEMAALGAPRGGQFKDWLSAISVSSDLRFVAAADISGMVQVWSLE